MASQRLAFLPLLAALALVACDASQPATQEPQKPAPTAAAPAAELPGADAFLASLALPSSFQVTDSRPMQGKRGRMGHVFAIDYKEGRVKTVDRTLAQALRAAGFKRGKAASVPGGVRVPYAAKDGRKVSTMIRNKKYFKDRIAADSAGQVSLTYVLPPKR